MAAEKKAFDYVRDVIRPADYNKLILPFAVLVLARKKAAMWDDADTVEVLE